MNKLFIKKEILVLHLIMLLTGKLFIGISIGLFFADLAFPWSYPLLLIGVLILLPTFYSMYKEESKTEKDLKRELVKKVKKKS